jgi:hypothetical protein
MLITPISGYTFVETLNTSNPDANTITPSIGSYSAWQEVIASTSAEADLLRLDTLCMWASDINDGNIDVYRFDVGVGPPGSEEVIAEALGGEGRQVFSVRNQGRQFDIHRTIPAGSRIAVRAKNLATTDAVTFGGSLYKSDAGIGSNSQLQAVGFDANGVGAVITLSGALAHAVGSWVEITPSTPFDADGFYIILMDDFNQSFSARLAMVEVGVGAAGLEVPITPKYPYRTINTEIELPVLMSPVAIPQGSRLSARRQDDVNAEFTGSVGIVLMEAVAAGGGGGSDFSGNFDATFVNGLFRLGGIT